MDSDERSAELMKELSESTDPIERKRGFDARATLEELQAIADWFGSVRGRKKTILFVSEGIEYDIEDMFNKIDASMIVDRTRDLIRSATKSNVSIYAIDPRGLSDMGAPAFAAVAAARRKSPNGDRFHEFS